MVIGNQTSIMVKVSCVTSMSKQFMKADGKIIRDLVREQLKDCLVKYYTKEGGKIINHMEMGSSYLKTIIIF